MQPGADLSRRELVEVAVEVRVAGIERKAISFDVGGETAGEIPGIDAGGTFAAAGSITWQPTAFARDTDEPVVERVSTPWSRRTTVSGEAWPPVAGDSVTIDVTVTDAATGESVTCRQFTGRILRTSGGIGQGPVSEVIDNTDQLNKPFRQRPMQYAMPSLDEPGRPPVPMQVAPMTLVHAALAAARRYVTSETRYDTTMLLATSGQGSFWPTTGVLEATRTWGSQLLSQPVVSPWGSGVLVPRDRSGGTAPAAIRSSGDAPWAYQRPHELTIDLPGRANLALEDPGLGTSSTDRESRLVVEPGAVPAFDLFRSQTGLSVQVIRGTTQLAVLSGFAADESLRVAVRLSQANPSADVLLRLAVRREDGTVLESAGVNIGARTASTRPARVIASKGVFGAITYRTLTDTDPAWRDLSREPSAIVRTAPRSTWSSNFGWWASRRWPGQGQYGTSLELLKEMSEALCAAIWLDEHGVFRWNDAEYSNRQPVASVLTTDSLGSLSWSEDGDRVRSSYEVVHRLPALTGGAKSSRPWVRYPVDGGGQSMHPEDDPLELFLKPAEDQDWVVPDNRWVVASPYGESERAGIPVLNRGERPAVAYVVEGPANNRNLTVLGEQVVDETRKIELRVTADGTTDDTRVVFKVPDMATSDGVSVSRYLIGTDTPRPTGWGLTTWAEDTWTEDNSEGANGQRYSHDAGWYVQSRTTARRLAEWMRSRVQGVASLDDGIDVSPDIRLQLQDVVRIEDPTFTGLAITGVIVGKKLAAAATEAGEVSLTQHLRLRVIRVDVLNATYGDVDILRRDQTYRQVDTDNQGRSYAAVDTNPRGV